MKKPALEKYAQMLHVHKKKNWHFLTGKKKTIYDISRNTFASEVRKLDDVKDMRKFAHTEHFYFIDGAGKLRGILNGTRVDILKSLDDVMAQLNKEESKSKASAKI